MRAIGERISHCCDACDSDLEQWARPSEQSGSLQRLRIDFLRSTAAGNGCSGGHRSANVGVYANAGTAALTMPQLHLEATTLQPLWLGKVGFGTFARLLRATIYCPGARSYWL
jgi:hypothetical protein